MSEAEWSPQFRALVEHCAGQPGAVRSDRWGETVFEVGRRVFAFLGSPERPSVTVKVAPAERNRLLGNSRVQRARYVGRFGWMTVWITDSESLHLALQLVDHSYNLGVSGGH
jgi:predicted DNA-binding protein (MmcQ/YjbR family)